ncbi:F420-dependent protein [Microbacterium mangrovi]|uniref:F420-dependent protein n=1 Tax=Microbacterium mangrovi TaxID=1348253 RepID=A0A0B2A553_9MICO|nr:TIGR03668 family PPOX class F420-dependent oxidoreductase [Microbacterium mangrovi]KHK96702.1 F420-dependent protein [Microbacterium mangrovi]
MDEAAARARLAAARVARLATVGDDGRPHVVPITFAVEDDLVFTAVDHKPKSTRRLQRLRNIARNPRVALLADEYVDDWTRLWWVRADGVATVVEDAERMRHPIDALVARYPQYREHRPEGPVIVIRVDAWSGWAGTGHPPIVSAV